LRCQEAESLIPETLYETSQKVELVPSWATLPLYVGLSLFQTLLGFVALKPTYILPVVLRIEKPNNGLTPSVPDNMLLEKT
jgi:hypothetical protein